MYLSYVNQCLFYVESCTILSIKVFLYLEIAQILSIEVFLYEKTERLI